MNQRKEIEKIRDDVVRIINNGKATFFVSKSNKDTKIDTDEALYELKADICTRVELYFYELFHPTKQ